MYNLQINTLAPAKVLIPSQRRANQAALDWPVNLLWPGAHHVMALSIYSPVHTLLCAQNVSLTKQKLISLSNIRHFPNYRKLQRSGVNFCLVGETASTHWPCTCILYNQQVFLRGLHEDVSQERKALHKYDQEETEGAQRFPDSPYSDQTFQMQL